MLRRLTLEQINDWFTVGKTVTNVELLGSPSAFPAALSRAPSAATRHPAGGGSEDRAEAAGGVFDKKSPEMEYVEKYRQLEAKECNTYGNDFANSGSALRPPLRQSKELIHLSETNYKYPDLPITRCKDEVVSLIENNSVVIIHGATGSGKSSQVPQFILDYYSQGSTYCNIVVTQPRKIGASSIARWISRERSWRLGNVVGYQVGLEKLASRNTKLIYMTTGVLLQKLVGAKSLREFTHIFIDEVHERTEEMDFLLLVVRKLLRTNSRFVKVILMSATIDYREFADYFAIPIHNKMNPASVYEVQGTPHSVEEFYLNDLLHITHGKLTPQVHDEPMITKDIYEVAISLILFFDDLEMQENGDPTKSSSRFLPERSSVLVFLPGLAEINHLLELLTNVVRKRLQVYPLHSSVTLEEQNNVFLSPVHGYRKIILSTNIAESSITVPDVKYVIDFCLTRTLVCDEDTNYQSLRLSWASKISCEQRKGRAGRVSKGYCYRLVFKEFWRNNIPDIAVPEMLRCPLGNTVLKVKLLDMGEPRALLATALSPPRLNDIERTILLLKEIGALAISEHRENPHDGELTFLGRVLAHLPVNLHLGKLIVLGHAFGCLEECLIIAASLSLKNFFAMPFNQHFDGYRNKVNFSGSSRSDCLALVDAFKSWQHRKQRGELRHPKDELEWGRSNCIQIRRIREVAELFEELKNRIKQFNMLIVAQPLALDPEYVYKQRFIIQVVLAGAFYPNYFTFGHCDEEIATRELCGKDPKTTIMLKHIPPYGFLYFKQLQTLFRPCGQIKSILFDGNKAFLEFSRSPVERFKVHPGVYMAMKMAQLKIPLELHIHSAEDIEVKLKGGSSVTSLRQKRVQVDFQRQMINPVHNSSDILEWSQMIKNTVLSIIVTEVVEVGHFWGYRIDELNLIILKNLTTEINQAKLMPLPMHPYPDLVCLAPYTDLGTAKYFRAQILNIYRNSAEVFFLDYGNKSEVTLDLLRMIPSCFLALPFQALEFKICRMRPSAKSLVCGEYWCHGASQRFASLISGCAIIVKIFSIVHSVLHVDVFRYSGVREAKNIRDVLIVENFAEPAEESHESIQRSEILKELFSKCIENNSKRISKSTQAKESEKCQIQKLLESFSTNRFGTKKHKATLQGPFNPFELRCHSMTRVSRFRSVWIEKESINSIIIRNAPEDVCQRMLVAASLSINASGSSMLLRETTLLPHVPGLPALISILFSPVVELRVDKNARYFTGALCGLGWNPNVDTPVLPEHDIELAFDVWITVEDIIEINILRANINKLVCGGPSGSRFLRQEVIAQLQGAVRQKLLDLVCRSKSREEIVPQWYSKPYEWNQVDPKFIVDQFESEGEKEKSPFLYQPHKLVILNA
ncbi:ATP-dependent RNA helicase TDRD9 isoform X2 [Ornithorhynchus anatinus]|uniref:ATP-dependent RNA helicase TDRD9 n=1 Tax=Ornithorhynchus anatinus TaxID=9258 RepID=A0A6I8NB77_ORNAN|nr:ATP-dependent RNA helicase TDRD9 isoform X2 [Ornithorhynchus anatinus]